MTGRCPVLHFSAQRDGGPPPVLRTGSTLGEWAARPSGGPPMRVLRRRKDVLEVLSDPFTFPMAGVTPGGERRGCPLTGAERQSPDGGLLNMNPPLLRVYRQQVAHLFSRRAAEYTRRSVQAIAGELTAALADRDEADVLAEFVAPFTAAAVCDTMGLPRTDWDEVLSYSRMAFAVVPGPDAVPQVDAAWDALYRYLGPYADPGAQGIAGGVAYAMHGHTPDQIVHVIGTTSNGFGALLPVLAVTLIELAADPHTVQACLDGYQSWGDAVAWQISTRAMFPVALPRMAAADTWLSGQHLEAGTTVLPSLIAAASDRDGRAPCDMAFGPGPHLCPGAALTRLWLPIAAAAFFKAFPKAHVAGPLEWQPGTLSVPREIRMLLR